MIKLRCIVKHDIEKVLRWRTSEQITKYMFTDIAFDLAEQEKWFESIYRDESYQSWIIVYNNHDIGFANLCDIDIFNRRCFKGYYIAEDYMIGVGLAKYLECNIYDYVFDNLELNKIYSDVLAFNERAIHIYKKFGSEVEGVFKQHIYKNGQFHDVVRMAILKDKWLKIRRNYNYDRIEIEPYK